MSQNITRYENKIMSATSMTDLLMAMSLWQSYCAANTVSEEEKNKINDIYLKAEAKLLSKISKSPW